jgi:hypothetical protein
VKSLRNFLKLFLVAAVVQAVLAASPLFACPACGSANGDMPSSPLTDGMNLGILTLFGVIATVLGSIATFFVFIIRRETALAKTAETQNLSEVKV